MIDLFANNKDLFRLATDRESLRQAIDVYSDLFDQVPLADDANSLGMSLRDIFMNELEDFAIYVATVEGEQLTVDKVHEINDMLGSNMTFQEAVCTAQYMSKDSYCAYTSSVPVSFEMLVWLFGQQGGLEGACSVANFYQQLAIYVRSLDGRRFDANDAAFLYTGNFFMHAIQVSDSGFLKAGVDKGRQQKQASIPSRKQGGDMGSATNTSSVTTDDDRHLNKLRGNDADSRSSDKSPSFFAAHKNMLACILVLILFVIMWFAFSKPSPNGSSEASGYEINVIGMPLSDACTELYDAGWTPHPVDETPYSDYVPGAWENGVHDYDDCIVTRVEFSPSSPAGRGYVTSPSCTVYFESNSQPQQEAIYDLDADLWLSWYDMLSEELAANGATEKTIADIDQAYNFILEYDDDMVPYSRKTAHQQLLERFQALLESVS